MKYKKNIIFLIAAFALCSLTTIAQDLHFSQFFNSPLTTNPANTGFIPDADYRVGGNYRNQWSSVMAQPYKTMSLFADAQVFRERMENGWLGLGCNTERCGRQWQFAFHKNIRVIGLPPDAW
jgi:hypothetical protein